MTASLRARPAPDVDTLAAEWCEALDAGRAALDAACLYLHGAELAAHTRRLEEDRAQAVPLLRDLARDQHRNGLLVRWLATPRHTRAMLSLPEAIDACVFDLEGVLTTSDALQAAAWAETLDPLLLARAASPERFAPFDLGHEYEEHLAARPRLEGIRSFLAARGLSLPDGRPGEAPGIETVAALAARKEQAVRTRLEREGVRAFDVAHGYLEAARLLDIGRAVVSASTHARAMLERAGLGELVDVVVDGSSIAAGMRGKPAPDTVLEACARLGVRPARAAAFETTAVGVRAARSAGLALVVGVARGGDVSASDVIVRDLGALFLAPLPSEAQQERLQAQHRRRGHAGG
jgi:HAD superfamily hydrolase (TIGR01509 family)